jgi:drug/metabolite transporter (DMT)-like permease
MGKMTKINLEHKATQWVVLLFLAFIWGSSFILMKKGLQSFNFFQVAAFRVFISFVVILPVSIKNLNKVNKGNIKSLLIVGFVGTAIPSALYTKAQTTIDSSIAGVLNSLTPLFTMVIGIIFYGTRVKNVQIAGIFIGLAGAFGLIHGFHSLNFNSINYYALFIVLATTCYGINVNEIKENLPNLSGFAIASLGFFFIGPFAGIYLFLSDMPPIFSDTENLINLGYVALLAIFGSVLALVIFNTLIKYTTSLFAASVTYIIPIFALLWGFFDGESIGVFDIFMMLVILLGVYLVNRKKKVIK